MTCCAACALARHAGDSRSLPRPNPTGDGLFSLDDITAAYQRIGHWWLVSAAATAAGYPAGGVLDARIRGLVGEPPNLTDLETAGLGGFLLESAETAWGWITDGARASFEIASENKWVLAIGAAALVAWDYLDTSNADALKQAEDDGTKLEALINSLPPADRAAAIKAAAVARFGAVPQSSGLPTWAVVGLVGIAGLIAWQVVK